MTGGFALAAQWAGFTTLAFVEIEPYAQEIIKQNFGAVADDNQQRCFHGQLEKFSNHGCKQAFGEFESSNFTPTLYGNILTFDGTAYRGATLLTGGFPCQPFSQAGKRRGTQDDRYLWPEMLRVISEARPAWVLGENVAGIVNMELDRVLSDLEGEGYSVQPIIIPACAVDAKHRRDRVWIVAHTDSGGLREQGICKEQPQRTEVVGAGEDVADAESWSEQVRATNGVSHKTLGRFASGGEPANAAGATWLPEPEFCGMVDGLPERLDGGEGFCSYGKEWEGVPRVATGVKNRVDRLKGLGNSIQPQVAFEILKEIRRQEIPDFNPDAP